MLVWLAAYLDKYASFLNVFVNYVSVRAILAALSALIIALFMGKPMINWLTKMQIGQVIRDDGPKSHLKKGNTPTMGGCLILFSITISVLLWAKLDSQFIWLVLFVLLGFGVIGFLDDYLKLVLKNPKGLRAKYKYLCQSLVAIIAMIWLYLALNPYMDFSLSIPFSKSWAVPLGIWVILLGYFVIVGASNAVNLTDGLDGLAILPIVLVAAGLGVYAYISTNNIFAGHLLFTYMPNVGIEELVVFCAAICGAGFGFLWFNAYPADVFMGDVGSLALGAALGVVAVIIRQELVLFIMGFLFVMETVSVILQVGSYKLRKKRIFKMAPLHHHYELKGWPETKVVVRFWILTIIFVCIGLMALKLR
ncbi:phospho-N-acetylmuramoyl-pentapeptide-transferase [Fangia hongkongensis]|uniref:phospho-N-acetylmuramoyl-pentapeptide- transferase n=1 Tax=Fangia hongkongensis TaxID=270495 RepID=UPI00035D48B7|nr:phospho-N-acetylmuramoyl-pentapeptide-transferase [Fangia hongkongensis]MBK2123736.1 phospho-N-acetylmuramoyl-pentapeptide-transferase [Fangia hongkongensis]